MIQFFDTLFGKLKPFDLLPGSEVKMYTCGPTVYDFAHIGNFRTFVFEDLLRRFLQYKGFKVKHVMNITDVDDKTIAGARREKKKLDDFTKTYIDAFQEDLNTLNVLAPNYPNEPPRATQEIPAMIELIEKLIRKDAAYVSDDSVYYRVASFPGYGKLSKKDLKQNIKSARVDLDEYEKEEGSDFALWKKAKEGEPSWDSPWGKGRPGWHIECSAMSMRYLGETFDIHAGGEDLIFPHHENEIAQSEGATGKPFVKYWIHSKHLLVNGEKMSKSKGNFYTLRDLLAKGYDPMAIRYILLATHYRTSLNFTLEGLDAAKNTLRDLKIFYSSVVNHATFGRKFSTDNRLKARIDELKSSIESALGDDLNISKALASLFSFIGQSDSEIKQGMISENDTKNLIEVLDDFNSMLGVIPDERFEMFPDEVKTLVKKREELRRAKHFQEADEYRRKVINMGYIFWDESTGASGIAR